MGAGRFLWSIDPRADIKRLCKAQFVVRYTLSSIVIRCFNHCLQTTPNNVLRVYCFSGCVGVDAEIEPRLLRAVYGRGALLWSIYPRADIKTVHRS